MDTAVIQLARRGACQWLLHCAATQLAQGILGALCHPIDRTARGCPRRRGESAGRCGSASVLPASHGVGCPGERRSGAIPRITPGDPYLAYGPNEASSTAVEPVQPRSPNAPVVTYDGWLDISAALRSSTGLLRRSMEPHCSPWPGYAGIAVRHSAARRGAHSHSVMCAADDDRAPRTDHFARPRARRPG